MVQESGGEAGESGGGGCGLAQRPAGPSPWPLRGTKLQLHMGLFSAVAIALAAGVAHTAVAAPPAVILHVIIDDLGWGDVSWHRNGSDFETPTPNMAALVAEGGCLGPIPADMLGLQFILPPPPLLTPPPSPHSRHAHAHALPCMYTHESRVRPRLRWVPGVNRRVSVAGAGVELNRHMVHFTCTASRSSYMTGKAHVGRPLDGTLCLCVCVTVVRHVRRVLCAA